MSDNSKGFLISIAPNPINQAEKWKMTAGYFANFGQNELPVGIFHCKKKKKICKTSFSSVKPMRMFSNITYKSRFWQRVRCYTRLEPSSSRQDSSTYVVSLNKSPSSTWIFHEPRCIPSFISITLIMLILACNFNQLGISNASCKEVPKYRSQSSDFRGCCCCNYKVPITR